MESDALTPQQQLDALAQARTELAGRTATPPWYYPVLGLMMGAYLGALTLLEGTWRTVGIGLFALGLIWLIGAYRRRTRIWMNAMSSPGKAYGLAIGLSYLGAVIAINVIRSEHWSLWWAVLPIAVAVLATVVLGPRWDRRIRTHLAGDVR